jgi:indole-3-glycerol phosphate synthase
MHALVEVHTAEELKKALNVQPSIIGINNRNLDTFSTDIETTVHLRALIPKGIITVSESGIDTPDDIRRLRTCGIHAFLIGESLMREADPGLKLGQLLCA